MTLERVVVMSGALAELLLRRGDDALVLGHRLSEWCGHAPLLEEELALANQALDLIGQTRLLYALAARHGAGADEDAIAYRRSDRQFRNLLLLEQPNGDFAATIVRQFLYAAFVDPWWRATMASTDADLAAIAAKAEKESAYHLRHSAEWLIRLGDGTVESHRRAQDALDWLWPFTGEMFEREDASLVAAGICCDVPGLRDTWNATVDQVLARATLHRPRDGWMQSGGRAGRHSEHLGHMLAVMQSVARSFPDAQW